MVQLKSRQYIWGIRSVVISFPNMWKALSFTFSTTVKEAIEESRHFSEDLEMTNRYGKRYNHANQSNLTEALFHSSYSAFSQKREKLTSVGL